MLLLKGIREGNSHSRKLMKGFIICGFITSNLHLIWNNWITMLRREAEGGNSFLRQWSRSTNQFIRNGIWIVCQRKVFVNGMMAKDTEICLLRGNSFIPKEVNITHLWNDIMSLLNSWTERQGIMIRTCSCARTSWRNIRKKGLTKSRGMTQGVRTWNLLTKEFTKISKSAKRPF